jgi:hypothetical protein
VSSFQTLHKIGKVDIPATRISLQLVPLVRVLPRRVGDDVVDADYEVVDDDKTN